MGTAKIKFDKEIEEGKERGMSRERSKAGSKKKFWWPIKTELKYNNNKHNMVIFYNIQKNNNEIPVTKNNMDLNNQKMKWLFLNNQKMIYDREKKCKCRIWF